METEAAVPPPAGDVGVLLRGRLLLLPASVRQSAADRRQAQAAVRRMQVRPLPRHTHMTRLGPAPPRPARLETESVFRLVLKPADV